MFQGKECPPPTTVRLPLEGGPLARYNTAFPARRGTEVAVTGSTRNRLGGASRHVGSNPTPSAIFRPQAENGVPVGFEREPAADEQEPRPRTMWNVTAGDPFIRTSDGEKSATHGRVRRSRRRRGGAPLPKELRSLGFPATIIPRGKLYRSTPTPSANVKCVVDVGWMFALPWTWQYPLVIENPLRFPYDIPLCDT